MAGLLLPSASVFLLLLCNDKEVLGPWVNPRWLNVLAVFIVGVLLLLSGILMATTLFPTIDVVTVSLYLAAVMIALATTAVIGLRWLGRRTGTRPVTPRDVDDEEKLRWRMPPLALLEPVRWSAGTKLGMLALRAYLLAGAILLLIKAIQLGGR